MKPYYILGTVEDINKRLESSKPDEIIKSDEKVMVFQGGREKLINGKLYIIVPLSEIARYFRIRVEDFLEDPMLDALSEIKKMTGYNPIINI